jgi:hypothetical protein
VYKVVDEWPLHVRAACLEAMSGIMVGYREFLTVRVPYVSSCGYLLTSIYAIRESMGPVADLFRRCC